MPVTCGSLPDDALASILGGLSAQEAARAEATSKAFRRLRPRIVAAQKGHALRDAKVRLTVATDGHAYETREIRSFNGMLLCQQSDVPRLTCVGIASDFIIKMNVMSPGRASPRYLTALGQAGAFLHFVDDWEQATHFERVETIRTADGQVYSTLPGASYIRFRVAGQPGPPRYLIIKGTAELYESALCPLHFAPESNLTVHRHDQPGDCHAFFFLDRLADTQPDFPVPRRLLLRGLERRYPEWLELDQSIISVASAAAQRDPQLSREDIERAAASFRATGSPEAWRAWRKTWRYPYRMPDPPWQFSD